MSPRTPPGQTREKVYRFIRKRLIEGRPPTIREVQEAFGFRAVQTAREHLDRLVVDGKLIHRKGKARGYDLPAAERRKARPRMVPVLGRVQAGGLTEAIQDAEGYLPVDAREGQELFGLRVRGDSMIGAGILPDDIVIVRVQSSATSGDIVVALVEEEATVKRLRLRDGRMELHPENPAFETIVPDPDRCTILGKVIEVRRFIEAPRP